MFPDYVRIPMHEYKRSYLDKMLEETQDIIRMQTEEMMTTSLFRVRPIRIEKVIFNDPATIVFWKDGTKTVVKCQDGDEYSKEHGLALCIAKKALGNKGNFNNVFRKWCE